MDKAAQENVPFVDQFSDPAMTPWIRQFPGTCCRKTEILTYAATAASKAFIAVSGAPYKVIASVGERFWRCSEVLTPA